MRITWHGYACFEIESGGYTLALDPYRAGTLAGFPALDLCADEVLCSHGHDGHCAAGDVKLRHSAAASPFEIETLETDHDVMGGRLRGKNLVRIIRAEGLKIIHLGDLGCKLSQDGMSRITGADALMVPVGGILTIEPYSAYELCRAASPRVILPMHYNVGGGSRRLRRLEEFTSLFAPVEVRFADTSGFVLTRETPSGVLALLPPWGSI